MQYISIANRSYVGRYTCRDDIMLATVIRINDPVQFGDVHYVFVTYNEELCRRDSFEVGLLDSHSIRS
jgi:hypothetical protein